MKGTTSTTALALRQLRTGAAKERLDIPTAQWWDKHTVHAASGCIEWKGSRSAAGYGTVYLGGGRANRETAYTHRLAYETFVGPIPDGMLVCHRCDNPPCVNREHLFLGTTSDNARDMVAKGRGSWILHNGYDRSKVCRNGHVRTPENTAWRRNAAGRVSRICRLCLSANKARWYRGAQARKAVAS